MSLQRSYKAICNRLLLVVIAEYLQQTVTLINDANFKGRIAGFHNVGYSGGACLKKSKGEKGKGG